MKKNTLIASFIAILIMTMSTGCFLRSNKESLHAFVVLDIGLLQQKDNLEMNNDYQLTQFMNQLVVNPKDDNIKRRSDKAIQVAKMSKELNDFIERMKVELVMKTDGVDESKAKERVQNPFMVERKGDYDRTTHYFGTSSPPGNQGKAHELKMKLMDQKKFFLQFVETGDQKTMEKKLGVLDLNDVEDKQTSTWEMFHFYHMPLSAALAELTRWQVIVKEMESVMFNYLRSGPTTSSMKFDAIEAIIVPDSTVVTAGSTFEADIFLSAYSTTTRHKITYGSDVDEETGSVIGGIELNDNKFTNGKGHISIPASGLGERSVGGTITVVNPVTGEETFYPFKTRYQVISKNTRGQFRKN